MTVHKSLTEDDLREIAEQVWMSYLDPEGVTPLVVVPTGPATSEVTASVSVTGAWRGHVVVTFSDAAARHAAAALLGIGFDDVTVADVSDGVGEIANIIGGNVKSLMPEPAALSLPAVLTGGPANVHWPSVAEVSRLNVEWLGEPIAVSVLESTSDKEG
jgi:chemotaxis protein CheX